jgi:hypothetical protein
MGFKVAEDRRNVGVLRLQQALKKKRYLALA